MKYLESYFNFALLVTAGLLAPVSTWLHKYLFDDWSFIITIMLALGVDLVLGTWRALREKSFAWSKLGTFGIKAGVYFAVLFIIHAAAFHEKNPAIKDIAEYLDSGLYWIFLGHELLSIIAHARALGVNVPDKVETLIDNSTKRNDK